MRRIRRGVLLALPVLAPLLAALAGCEIPMRPLEEQFGEVALHVADERGQPVPETRLELRSAVRRMGIGVSNGEGELRFRYIPPEFYLINITAPEGYAPAALQANPVLHVEVKVGERTGVPIVLTDRIGDVLVEVTDTAGSPVAGVRLELRNARQHIAQGVTGVDGLFRVRGVAEESYLVNVTFPAGYRLAPGQPNPVLHVRVSAGQTTHVPVRLERI